MDETRRYDIEELSERYKESRSEAERDYFEGLIRKIYRETPEIKEQRYLLLKEIRRGDRNRVKYIQEKLRKLDKDLTGGRETIKL